MPACVAPCACRGRAWVCLQLPRSTILLSLCIQGPHTLKYHAELKRIFGCGTEMAAAWDARRQFSLAVFAAIAAVSPALGLNVQADCTMVNGTMWGALRRARECRDGACRAAQCHGSGAAQRWRCVRTDRGRPHSTDGSSCRTALYQVCCFGSPLRRALKRLERGVQVAPGQSLRSATLWHLVHPWGDCVAIALRIVLARRGRGARIKHGA